MQLSFLLLVLYLKMKWASRNHAAFQRYIGTIRVRILIKTADGKWGRLFIFDKGTLRSLSGGKHACDAALVWSDPASAVKTMLARTDEASFMAAAQGKLKVEGMSYFIQWFNDGLKLIM